MLKIKEDIENFWENKDSINFSDEELKKTILSVLESLDSGKITLPCGHSYHCVCILQWFDKKLECPYCKQKMRWHKD